MGSPWKAHQGSTAGAWGLLCRLCAWAARVRGRIWLGGPSVVVPGAGASGAEASACGFGELYGPVRGCPQDWRRG
jgi:hypothetical protein